MKKTLLVVCLLGVVACGKSEPAAVSSPAVSPTTIATLAPTTSPTPTVAPTPASATAAPATAAPKTAVASSSVAGPDRVSAADGGIKKDGHPDYVFATTLAGQIDNIVVTVCDSANKNSNHHWDTFTGNRPIPSGFYYTVGNQTWVIGVVDTAGKMISRPDGSIPRLVLAKPTQFRLHGAPDGSVTKGTRICLTVFRPDGSRSVAATTVG
jgi:hypothetical protein